MCGVGGGGEERERRGEREGGRGDGGMSKLGIHLGCEPEPQILAIGTIWGE